MLRRAVGFLAVLAGLCGLWEAYKWVGESLELTWPFPVNDRTLPHVHDIVGQLFEPSRRNGPLLIEVLWDAALFTAKEAFVGFLLGATVGFVIGVILVHSNLLQRGFLPYIVASQTVPILAVAPMVVVWLGGRGLPGWFSVSVIAAYLTFFPVTINALRGLQSADPRAMELMHRRARHGACRARRRDRRPGQAGAGRRPHGAALPRAHAPAGDGGRGHQPGHPALP